VAVSKQDVVNAVILNSAQGGQGGYSFDLNDAMNRTKQFEGFRDTVYKDTQGHPTIGYGFKLSEFSNKLPRQVMTGKAKLDRRTADSLFAPRFNTAIADAKAFAGDAFNTLTPIQQRILVDMAYNLGKTRLSGFKGMRENIQSGNMVGAREEMKDSKWFGQVGNRSKTHYADWLSNAS
jgi:lysozyme